MRLSAILLLVMLAAPAYGGERIIISNEKGGTLTVLDAATNQQSQTIDVCGRPRHMAWTRDRTALMVACADDNSIAVLDAQSLKPIRRIERVTEIEAFDTDPEERLLFASNEGTAGLSILDMATGKMLGRVEIGEEPEGVLFVPQTRQVWVASEATNLVHVIDPESREVVKDLATGARPRRIKPSPDWREIWVSCEIAGTVEIYDPRSLALLAEISFTPRGIRPEEIMPVDIVFSRDGKTAWVALGRANHVALVDVATRKVLDYVLVGQRPWGLAFGPGEKSLYVTNGLSDDVTVIDPKSRRAVLSVPVGEVPYGALSDD
jgi:PQQ-dependent catabolism-associated beta-propeller protein